MNILSQPTFSADEVKKELKKINKNKREEQLKKVIKSTRVINLLLKEDYTTIQILIFEYLGFKEILDGIKNNKKESLLLSIIFKTEGFENIRKKLSDIKQLKTLENLQVLEDLFEELNLNNPLKKVQEDLIRNRKNKR